MRVFSRLLHSVPLPVDILLPRLPKTLLDLTRIQPKAKAEVGPMILAKPKMRGLLASAIKRELFTAALLACVSGYAFKRLVADERKRKYAEFYRNFNAEEMFQEMRKKGLFQSC